MRQGIAPCLGIADALEADDFFLIFGPAIETQLRRAERKSKSSRSPAFSRNYFLNKLSNAARASLALRGVAIMVPFPGDWETAPPGAESRATVTRGENSSHEFAWSLIAMRIGIGFRH